MVVVGGGADPSSLGTVANQSSSNSRNVSYRLFSVGVGGGGGVQ